MDPEVQTEDDPLQTREIIETREPQQLTQINKNSPTEDEKITNEPDTEEKDVEALNEDAEKHKNDDSNHTLQDEQPIDRADVSSNELSSDEEHALLDRTQVVEVFEKMMRDSMQKVIDSSYSSTSSDPNVQDEIEQLDKILHTDPQKLLLLNGHKGEELDRQVESINQEIAREIEGQIEGELLNFSNRHSPDSSFEESKIEIYKDKIEEDSKEDLINDDSEENNLKNGVFDDTELKIEQIMTDSESEIQVENELGSNSQEEPILTNQKDEEIVSKMQRSEKQVPAQNVTFKQPKILEEDAESAPKTSSYIEDLKNLFQSDKSSPKTSSYKEELKKLLQSDQSKPKSKPAEEQLPNENEGEEVGDDEEEHQIDGHMREYLQENEENDDPLEHNEYGYKKEKEKKKFHEGPFIELSNDILSYERFYPGRILGNTFTVMNKTDQTLFINLSFSSEKINKQYVTSRLLEFYEISNPDEIEQPYLKYLKNDFVDAEKEFECWFIEDPYKKNLVKKVEYELKPYDSFEFIIVLKSPIVKKTHFLMSNVIVQSPNEKFAVFAFGSLDVPGL